MAVGGLVAMRAPSVKTHICQSQGEVGHQSIGLLAGDGE